MATDVTTSNTPTELDLAFIIDATSSMSPYINSAQKNMRKIIQDIILSERCLLNVALILYRDHPPQDSTFVIQVNDFTDDAEEAKKNIDRAAARGGGDLPEAITPALHAAVHTLSWRTNAVKIALLIADAPPHGLDPANDTWPDGDPSGYDPIECVASLAERSVTLYTIGCEPQITPYRDFFMALAFKTGGQYIPLDNCANLSSVIVGSAREEISLERLIAQVHEEVMREAALRGGPVDETELTRRIHEVMHGGGAKARRLKMDDQSGTTNIPAVTPAAEHLSTLTTLKEVREKWVRNSGTTGTGFTSIFGGLSSVGTTTIALPAAPIAKKRARTRTPAIKTKPAKRKRAPTVKPVIRKKPRPEPAKRKRTPTVTPIIKKKPRPTLTSGNRRSVRLTLNNNNDENEESTDNEVMDTTIPAASTPIVPTPVASTPATKPAKLRSEISDIVLNEDELLDISQTRRLVRKCIARNKLKTT